MLEKRTMRALMLTGTLILLTSCATGGSETNCAWVRPIYISKNDVLTEGTARAILAHNEARAAVCAR